MSDTFHDLCAGFCAIANVATPELREQDDHTVAFNVKWRDVDVDVMVVPAISREHVFMLFELGMPDTAQVDAGRAMMALLHVNFLSMRADAPVFGCRPDTGAAVLRICLPLGEATPAILHQAADEGAALALRWRQTGFLNASADADESPSVPSLFAWESRP